MGWESHAQVHNPKTNRTAMQCPMSSCPKECGIIQTISAPNPNKTKGAPVTIRKNITVCEFAWFSGACAAMRPPPPPKPPIKKITTCRAGTAMVGGVCVPVIGPGHCVITVGVKAKPFDPTDHTVVAVGAGLYSIAAFVCQTLNTLEDLV